MGQLETDLRDTAENLVAALARAGVELTYDRAGVAALDAYIERNRSNWSPADCEKLCITTGCFLGECMVQVYGCRWQAQDDGKEPVVALPVGGMAMPMTKAFKHLTGDASDSVLSFFAVIGAIIEKGGFDKL